MRARRLGIVVASTIALVACTGTSLNASASGPSSPIAAGAPAGAAAKVTVDRVLTRGLVSPWGLAFLPDGSALVSERDTGRILRIPADGGPARLVGVVRGVVPGGEGGLLGLAVPNGADPTVVFAYYTSATDNRVVRLGWNGSRVTGQQPIVTGIPKNTFHNGGRLLVGPEDTLFIATGDAGNPELAQQRDSLAGKVLRVRFDGRPAPGNPFPRSAVYTLGHRNVQGLALDARGRAWASEFGEKDVDELNRLIPGGNYGWPRHEGAGNESGFVDPFVEWSPTSTASPSGIAIRDNVAYVASLRGQTLWTVPLTGPRAGRATSLGLGDLGRLRTVAVAPDGALWLVTSNTDGRGEPRRDDDRVLRLVVS